MEVAFLLTHNIKAEQMVVGSNPSSGSREGLKQQAKQRLIRLSVAKIWDSCMQANEMNLKIR